MPSFIPLVAADVRAIHEQLAADFAKHDDPILTGIRSEDLLESALTRQTTGIGKHEKYGSVHEVAATVFFGIVTNHAFLDGNKRTATVALLAFLDINGYTLEVSEEDLFEFVVAVVEHRVIDSTKVDDQVQAIARWIRDRARRIDGRNHPLRMRRLIQILSDFGFQKQILPSNQVRFYNGRGMANVFHYDGEGVELGRELVRDIRKKLQLDEEHGVDSVRFYAGEDVTLDFIQRYQRTLRSLSRYDKKTS